MSDLCGTLNSLTSEVARTYPLHVSRGHYMQVPRPGMFAIVRNRRGVISAVEPFDGESGRLHVVHIDYKD